MAIIRGTIKELADKVTINGKVMGQPELSFITRLGEGTFARKVGSVKTSVGKGKPATIWEFDTEISLTMANGESDSPAEASVKPASEPVTSEPVNVTLRPSANRPRNFLASTAKKEEGTYTLAEAREMEARGDVGDEAEPAPRFL